MSRLKEILTPSGYSLGTNHIMLDQRYGAMMGYNPRWDEWLGNQPYVGKNTIVLLLKEPEGFHYLPNPEVWIGTLRSLVEVQKIRLTGLQQGLNVETTETPVGGAGQMFEEPTDVKEERSQVVFSFNEKAGQPVFHFHAGWIRNLIMDPNSKVAAVTTLGLQRIPDLLPDMRGAVMAFMEPDATHTRVVKAWIGANMYPKTTGENIGQFDLTAPQDKKDLDIAYTGIFQTGYGVMATCQRLLDAMNLTNANPYAAQSMVSDISAEVMAGIGDNYRGGIEDLAQTAVRL